MNMSDIREILGISAGLNTPILIYIAWLMYRLYSNHLPHIDTTLADLKVDVAYLKGRQDQRHDDDVARGTGKV